MKILELEEIKVEREALRRREKLLNGRESEINKHQIDASLITVDDLLIKDDVDERVVNFIMGHSRGFVDGFIEALNEIIGALSCEYRDIKMTEDELYMLVQLGERKERAWLKDDKQVRILKKHGWEMIFDIGGRHWQKKAEEVDDDT
ncbi:MAG: hypothetical protein J6P16_01710 [Eubacterium sp.]|nr:hypothetical protein [Eubacterium sp.]